MEYRERISVNPKVMLGKPVITGTRITIELIVRRLAEGMTIEDILKAYPHLTKEDVLAVLSYSADVLSEEIMIEF